MEEIESYWQVGDEICDKFDDEKKPYIILKVEEGKDKPNRQWMLTLDRNTGAVIYNNAVYVKKTGRQWDVPIDALDYLEKILESEDSWEEIRIPKKLITSQKLQLI